MDKATPAVALILVAFATMASAGTVGPNDVSFESFAVPTLTGSAGDAASGKEVLVDRKLGNCLACHQVSDVSEHLFHGDVGPKLDGVATRYPEEMLRAIVINPKKIFGPQTIMPGFYSLEVGVDVDEELVGKTILTAAEIEDVVTYLKTLTEE